MGILDGIVEWIAEQVMNALDLVTTSVLGALGCDMNVFLRYFPAAETMYKVFVALAIGIILLNWVWQLFKNFGLGAGIEAEDPVRLSIRSVLFILLAYFSDGIVDTVLKIGGTPYHWIMDSDLPALSFADFNSVMLAIIGVCANGTVALIALIVVLVLAWMVLCQEKVQVKRGLFVESMESYSTVFCDHVFQIIQFGYHLFTEFLNPIHDVFQQITQFCSLPNQCLHVFRLHPALPPFILSIPPLSPASHSNS